MSRPVTPLLLLAVLIGAGATGFLVVNLAAPGDSVRRAAADQEPVVDPAAGGGRVAGETPPAERATPARVERAGPGAAGLEGSRKPFDGPEFAAELAAGSARLLEILDAIPKETDPQKRQGLSLELEALLRRLGHRVDAATKAKLVDLLLTVEREWRALVGRALGAIQGDEALARRLVQLGAEQAGDVYTAMALFHAIGQMKVEAVVPDLVGMLGKAHPHEALVVRALGEIGGAAGAEALVARLGQPLRPETRQAIEAVLGNSREPAVLDSVAAALDGAASSVRGSLLDILGMSRDPRYAARVRELLAQERDEEVVRRCLRALGRFGDPESGQALLDVVERGGTMADEAVRAIHEVRNPETLAAVAHQYDRLGPAGRLAVMGATASLANPPDGLRALALSALEDPDERVRNFAASSLGRAGRDDHVEALAEFLKRSASPRERSAGLEALLRINTKAAAEAVVSLLDRLPEALREGYRVRCQRILERRTG